MAWTVRVTKIDDEGEFMTVFGQLVLTGAYVAGGDSVGAFDFTTPNTAGLPVFLSGQTALHATRGPFEYNIQIDAGSIAVLIPGATPTSSKIKLWVSSTGAEVGAGAYPAGLLNATFSTVTMKFKKLI